MDAVKGGSQTKEQSSNMEKKPLPTDTKMVDEDLSTTCGFGNFRPPWLQRLATTKVFLVNYCILGVFQGAHFSYLVGCLSTLEKRFAYDSKTSGVIMISDELPPVLFGLLVGYFGAKSHRPRILTLGMLIGVASCFTMAMPYLVYGPAQHFTSVSLLNPNGTRQELCDSGDSRPCETPTVAAVVLLFLGNFLKGFCSLTFYTIGPAYLDDSVHKKNSPLYFGTASALRLLGPTLGFLLSSFCLQFYEDPFVDPGFDQKDPRWIGAWWLGFVIIGVGILVCSLPLSLFPREFAKQNSSEEKKDAESKPKTSQTTMEHVKGMKDVTIRLLKNPVYVFHVMGSVFYLNGVAGFYVNLPRYMEAQFRQTPSKASLYSGPASIISMQFGTFLGGFVIKKFRPRARVLTGFMVFVNAICVIGILSCMTFSCPPLQMTGTSMYDGRILKLDNTCNAGCRCTTRAHTPVCGPDGKSTYFSPCFAGCTGVNETDGKKVFTGCQCVHDELGAFVEGDVKSGPCEAECGYMVPYIAVLSAGKLIASTTTVGSMVVYLRSVSPEDKTVALGIVEGALSLLAFIPYPLVYGSLMDLSCRVWEKSCGRTGNCWLYDVDRFRYFLHAVTGGFVFLATLMYALMCVYSGKLTNLYDDENENRTEQETNSALKGKQMELVKMKYIGDSQPVVSNGDKQ